MRSWIKFNDVYYNLDVLLRIESNTTGGFVLKHPNQTVIIPNTPENQQAISGINEKRLE